MNHFSWSVAVQKYIWQIHSKIISYVNFINQFTQKISSEIVLSELFQK